MKKPAAFLGLFALAAVSVALAARPKPMECDAWLCKGKACAPAKYAKVRSAPTILPIFASPLYGAAVVEGGAGLAAFALGSAIARRRRLATDSRGGAPAPSETTGS